MVFRDELSLKIHVGEHGRIKRLWHRLRMKRSENIGLCATCRHVETIASTRGSSFYLCQLALADPRFSKYPTLPVLACGGYEPLAERTREGES